MSLTTAFEEVTDRQDRNALITIYQKSLGINLSKEAQTSVPGGDIPERYGVLGFLRVCVLVDLDSQVTAETESQAAGGMGGDIGPS